MDVDQIAARAADIRFTRILLTVIAFPFWLLGWAVGVLWVIGAWLIAAGQVGAADARARFGPQRPAGDE